MGLCILFYVKLHSDLSQLQTHFQKIVFLNSEFELSPKLRRGLEISSAEVSLYLSLSPLPAAAAAGMAE